MRPLLVFAASLLLTGCPNRHHEEPPRVIETPSAPEPALPVPIDDVAIAENRRRRMRGKELGYFWSDTQQMIETAGCVTFTHIPVILFEWKADSYGFKLMRDGIEAGHSRFVVTIGEFGFTKQGREFVYYGSDATRAKLRVFMATMQDAGLLYKVVAWVAPDEPNLDTKETAPIADADLRSYAADVDAVTTEFLGHALPQWVVYAGGNRYRPALDCFAVIWIDHYDIGLRVIALLRDLDLREGQQYGLVPQVARMGDRDPEWPQAWVDLVLLDDNCIGLWPFNFCGFEGQPGLRDAHADVRQAWLDVGKEFIAAQTEM